MLVIPFLSALAQGMQAVTDKFGLSKQKIPLRQYVPFLFLYLFIFSLFAVPFFGAADWHKLLMPEYLFLFLLMLILAVTWNIFYYESLQKEELYEFETIVMFVPLVIIFLSWLFLNEAWDMRVGAAGLIAGVALVLGHFDKHHLKWSHYSMNLGVAVLLMATEEIIAAQLLVDKVFSPVSMYALRTFILFAFFFAYFRPKVQQMNPKSQNIVSLAGLLGAIFMVLRYYGYQDLGVPFTALVTMSAPLSVYVGSAFVIRERMKWQVVLSAVVIGAAIVYATSILKAA